MAPVNIEASKLFQMLTADTFQMCKRKSNDHWNSEAVTFSKIIIIDRQKDLLVLYQWENMDRKSADFYSLGLHTEKHSSSWTN